MTIEQLKGINMDVVVHAQTVQGAYNAMGGPKRDAADLIFGAIATGDSEIGGDTPVADGKTLSEVYATMNDTEKQIVAFIAGGISSDAQHSMDDEDFLAHYGRRGMKWGQHIFESKSGGITKSLSKSTSNDAGMRAVSRSLVKKDMTSLHNAHIAGLKTTGHRVANGVLGDKTFWKRQGIIAGVSLAGVGLSFAAPALLPASILTHVGMTAAASSAASGHAVLLGGGAAAGNHAATVAGTAVLTKAAAVSLGQQTALGIGLTTTMIGNNVANLANYGNNVARAVRGNSRINESYQKIGENIHNYQKTGSKSVIKVLNQSGSISKKHLKQDDLTQAGDNFLVHYGRRGMKWGQRIFSGRGGSSSPGSGSGASSSKHAPSEDFARAAAAMTKPAHSLSNTEMKALIDRLDLEKRYSQVVTPAKPATRGTRAKKFVSGLLLEVGKNELTRVAKSAAAIQVERAISKDAHGGKAFKDVLAKRIQPSKK